MLTQRNNLIAINRTKEFFAKTSVIKNKKPLINFLIGALLMGSYACNRPEDQDRKSVDSIVFPEVEHLPVQQSLPELLVSREGEIVNTARKWEERRAHIMKMLVHYQYGEMPLVSQETRIMETGRDTINGNVHSSYDFTITRNRRSLSFRVGLIRPSEKGAYPVIIKNDRYRFDMNEIEDEVSREKYTKQNRLAIDQFVASAATERGYIYCKYIREDIARDSNGPKEGRIFDLYPEYNWGAITAWAWAYQIIIDWLEAQSWTDTGKVVATGHSRGGKTALCAGIFDQRIAITAPNSSGLGGTGSLRFYDFTKGNIQTIDHQVRNFTHWWPERWYTLKDHIQHVPFDTHFAKALIAPRALFNTHARHDLWANPYGTHLTYLAAQPVFDLYGVGRNNAIHWRDGGHAQDKEDWLALLDYCDMIFYGKDTERSFGTNPYPGVYQFDSLEPHDVTKLKR